MSSTAKHQPNWSQDGGGTKSWFLFPTGAQSVAWQRIDEGVLTPNTGDYIYAMGHDARMELKFDWTSLSTNIDDVYEFIVDLLYNGQNAGLNPYMRIELWTDYPTTKYRLVDYQEFGTLTGGGFFSTSVSFDNISMTRNELAAAHIIVFALGSATPIDPPPYHRP